VHASIARALTGCPGPADALDAGAGPACPGPKVLRPRQRLLAQGRARAGGHGGGPAGGVPGEDCRVNIRIKICVAHESLSQRTLPPRKSIFTPPLSGGLDLTDSCLLHKMRVSCSACADWPRALQSTSSAQRRTTLALTSTQVVPFLRHRRIPEKPTKATPAHPPPAMCALKDPP